ncbi:MAG: MoxR family ATPase, partial [Pirellulaceae bacterium]|nr:MoxR family ATPase [Pirellulaceae bacterium]
EADILLMHGSRVELDDRLARLDTVTSPEEIMRLGIAFGETRIDPKLVDFINRIVRLTREWPQFHMGASPRAGLALVQGARTLAAFRGRDYAVPDDVVELALPVLRHRVMLSAEAEVEGQKVDDLLRALLNSVEVPRL